MSDDIFDLDTLAARRDEAIEATLPRLMAEADEHLDHEDSDDVAVRLRLLMSACALADIPRATRAQVPELRAMIADTIERARTALAITAVGSNDSLWDLRRAGHSEARMRLEGAEREARRLSTRAGRRQYAEENDLVAALWRGCDTVAEVVIATALAQGDVIAARDALARRMTLLGAPERAAAMATVDLSLAQRLVQAEAVHERPRRPWVLAADRCDATMIADRAHSRLAGREWEAYQVRTGSESLTGERVRAGQLMGYLRRLWRQQQMLAQYPEVRVVASAPGDVLDFLRLVPTAVRQLVITPGERRNTFLLTLALAFSLDTPAGARTWTVRTVLAETSAKTAQGRRRAGEKALESLGHTVSLAAVPIAEIARHRDPLPHSWPTLGAPQDPEALVGTHTCTHPRGEWQRNSNRDAIVLACPDCGFDRVAVVPLHRAPAREEFLRFVRDDAYVRSERFHRILAGQPDPGAHVTMDQLREADGPVSLNPGHYAIGLPSRPTTAAPRGGLRAQLAGRIPVPA